MFKKRIKNVGVMIGQFLLIGGGFSLFLWAAVEWAWLGKTIEYAGISLFVIMAILAVLMLIYYVCKFIYWLFIEPFRKQED
jgi:hypothetical protein